MKKFSWIAGVLHIFMTPDDLQSKPGGVLECWLTIDEFTAVKATCSNRDPAVMVVIEEEYTDLAYEAMESVVHAGGACQLFLKPVPLRIPKPPKIIDGRDSKYLTLKSVLAEMEAKSEKGLVAAWQIKEWVTKLKESV